MRTPKYESEQPIFTRKAFKPAKSKDMSSDEDFQTTTPTQKDPFEILKQMQKSLALVTAPDKKKDMQNRQVTEIKQILEGFASTGKDIAAFVIEVIRQVDAWNLQPAKETQGMMAHGLAPSLQGLASILDFALSQPKVRD